MSENKTNPTEAEILIVDDEPDSVRLLIDILEGRGYKLRPAVEGAQALSAARQAPPDLILLDVAMPDMSGYEVCQQLKADEATQNIPVIFVSGAAETLDKVKAFSVGGVDYIIKPFEADELLVRMQTQLSLSKLNQALEKRVEKRTEQLTAANAKLQAEIIERKQIEELLATSEARYRAIVEDQTELICRFRPDGTPTFVNQAYCRYFGVTPEQVEANGFVPLTYEEDRVMTEAYLTSLSQGKEVGMLEQRVVKVDGEIRWIQWQDRAIFDEQGQIIEFQGVGRDITERKKAGEELFRREQAFRALAENAPDIIARFDRDLRHIYVNKAVEAATGLAPETFIGKSNAELNMPPEQLSVWNETTRQIFEIGREKMLEFSFPTPTGEKHFQSRLVPEYAQDGSVESVLVMTRDITGQKQLEQELRTHQQHLEELVAKRTAALAKANEQLRQEIAQRKKAEAELKQRNQELLLLQAAGEAVASSLELRDVLDTVTEQLMKLLDVDGCTISNWDQARNIVHALAEHSPKFWFNLDANAKEYDLAQYPLTKKVLDERQPAQVHLSQPDADPAELSLMQKLGTKSVLMLPMISKGEMLGLVELSDSRWERPFTEPQIKLASLLANQTANAIQNARLYQEAQREITERQRVEATLRISQERYDLATRAAKVGVWDRNIQTGDFHLDRNVKALLGYRDEEIPNDFAVWTTYIHPDERRLVMQAVQAHLAGHTPEFVYEQRMQHRDGSIRWFFTRGTAIRDEQGQAIRMVGTDIDITERKRIEIALQHTNELLEQSLVELATLNLIAQTLATVLDFEAALEIVTGTVTRLFDVSGTSINLLNNTGTEMRIAASFRRGPLDSPSEAEKWNASELVGLVFPVADDPLWQQVIRERQSIVISQAQTSPGLAPAPELVQARQPHSVMIVPLLAQAEVIGTLSLVTGQVERVFTPEEISLAETVAGQVAGAIENSRLQKQKQEAAAIDERSRLARELHDAVTQTLFSANLIADGLPRVWERSPAKGLRGLEKLRQLTQGALAEMRTLLLELRPAAIIERPLDQLLQQLSQAMSNRSRVPITLTTDGSRVLEPELQLALYRIAQEALNNIVKHAEARQVRLILVCQPPRGELRIVDDGCGFDRNSPSPEAMGLSIMAERAMGVGAHLNIESWPGRGTTIEVTWQQMEQAS